MLKIELMNREMKFKAYHKVTNEVFQVKGLSFDKNKVIILEDFNNAGNPLNSEDYHVVQFTGLQDKNGVDIYEGDILKHKYSYLGGLVELDEGIYYCFYDYENFYESEQFEIIGNIHQNPNLLNNE